MAFMMAAFFRAALFCELGSVATTLQEKNASKIKWVLFGN